MNNNDLKITPTVEPEDSPEFAFAMEAIELLISQSRVEDSDVVFCAGGYELYVPLLALQNDEAGVMFHVLDVMNGLFSIGEAGMKLENVSARRKTFKRIVLH